MAKTAILFGGIGSIFETSELQREAFNVAFRDFGLDWHWDRETYRAMLEGAGGSNRIANYAQRLGANVDIKEIHRRKSEGFQSVLRGSDIPTRPGVREVIEYARSNGIMLGFATTTTQTNVAAILDTVAHSIPRDAFNFLGNNDRVRRAKPSPDIYHVALKALNVAPKDAIAIEDSQSGVAAAVAAHIRCVAFPGDNTQTQDFSNAVAKVDALITSDLQKLLTRELS